MNILLLNVPRQLIISVGPGSFDYSSRLSSIKFNIEDTLKIIKSVNVNKAHGHDVISVRKIKLCCQSIVKLFSYSKILLVIPDIWKKSSIIPIQKVANRSLTGHEQIINRSLTIIDQCLFYKFVATLLSNSVFQFL